MTIYEVKERTRETEPYFFSRSTMKFFGQTLKDFTVCRMNDGSGKYFVQAKSKNGFITERLFNPNTNKLEGSIRGTSTI